MSEQIDKVSGVDQIPIFPLPLNLMPYEIVPLHIFEPRYRAMITDIETGNSIFGVSWIGSKNDYVEQPEIGSIGCAAEITEYQHLEAGRSNILTIGIIRYRISRYIDVGKPYLTAEIEFFEDEDEDEDVDLKPMADEVYELFQRVANAAHGLLGGTNPNPVLARAKPECLSFLVSSALDLDDTKKRELIKMRETGKRLEYIKRILAKTAAKLEDRERIEKISRTNGHSNKPIDLS